MNNQSFTLRQANAADASAICAVLRTSIQICCITDHQNDAQKLAAWLENKTPESVLRWLASAGIALVAEEDAEVVGFAQCKADGELTLCYLLPQARFCGVGKALLLGVQDWAQQAGIASLFCESTLTAQAFYLRNGFVADGEPTDWCGMQGLPMRKFLC